MIWSFHSRLSQIQTSLRGVRISLDVCDILQQLACYCIHKHLRSAIVGLLRWFYWCHVNLSAYVSHSLPVACLIGASNERLYCQRKQGKGGKQGTSNEQLYCGASHLDGERGSSFPPFQIMPMFCVLISFYMSMFSSLCVLMTSYVLAAQPCTDFFLVFQGISCGKDSRVINRSVLYFFSSFYSTSFSCHLDTVLLSRALYCWFEHQHKFYDKR